MTEPKSCLSSGRGSLPPEFAPWPFYAADELEAVQEVLLSGRVNYWTGSIAREFEAEYAAAANVQHAVAVANGTIALELALIASGIGPGDEVVTTPRSFIASAGCAVMRGARPVFADVDPDSQNITAETIEPVLNDRTRAIVAVHLAGWPCEMDGILELASHHDIVVVEDCAQANGARYRGRPVGGIGHVAGFSFCQDKIISTGGEGGMLTTNDRNVWSKAWAYKDHGKDFSAVYERDHAPGFRWVHESFGTNWRMTEMQAAIGRVQLRKLESWTSIRRRHACQLQDGLRDIACLRIPQPPEYVEHAYYRFYAFVVPQALRQGWSRDRIVDEIAAAGVPCFHGSCSEIYLEKAFEHSGSRPTERLRAARELGATSLALLVHPTLTEEHIARAIDTVRRVCIAATR